MKRRQHIRIFLLIIPVVYLFPSQVMAYEKIKGVSFVGSNSPIDIQDIQPIVALNSNWVTLMPYGFVGEEGVVKFNSSWQWWGEKEVGIKETIELCKAVGLKIMLKPQIWMDGTYTGDFKLSDKKAWKEFEESYRAFISFFLKMAIHDNVEMFCLGTEWREFIAERPLFWKELIDGAKATYKGALTYAANWDDYRAFPYWRDLDYVGVNGYFPISYSSDPSLKELISGWDLRKKELAEFSKKQERKIIFTEIGYRSMKGATVKPWEHETRDKYSAEIQDKAFRALFTVLWKEDWFQGMFIWKWFHNHDSMGGKGNLGFTPQNKTAEETIRAFWGEKNE